LELAAFAAELLVVLGSEPQATPTVANIDTKVNKKYIFLILFALQPAAADHETL